MSKRPERDLNDVQRKALKDERIKQNDDPNYNKGYRPYINSETEMIAWERKPEWSKIIIGIILALAITGIITMLIILVTRPTATGINEDKIIDAVNDATINEEDLANLIADRLLDEGLATKEDIQQLLEKLNSIEILLQECNVSSAKRPWWIFNIMELMTPEQYNELMSWISSSPGKTPPIVIEPQSWSLKSGGKRSILIYEGGTEVDIEFVPGAYITLAKESRVTKKTQEKIEVLVIRIWPPKYNDSNSQKGKGGIQEIITDGKSSDGHSKDRGGKGGDSGSSKPSDDDDDDDDNDDDDVIGGIVVPEGNASEPASITDNIENEKVDNVTGEVISDEVTNYNTTPEEQEQIESYINDKYGVS